MGNLLISNADDLIAAEHQMSIKETIHVNGLEELFIHYRPSTNVNDYYHSFLYLETQHSVWHTADASVFAERMNEGASHGNSWMKRIQAKGKGGTVALELMLPVEKRLTRISRKLSFEVFSWKLRAKRDSCLEEGQSHLPSAVNAGNGAKILPRRWFRINIDRKTHEPLKPIALFQ